MVIGIFRKFLRLESAGGILLFLAAMMALMIANSPLREYYDHLMHMTLAVQIGDASLSKPFILWVNDGLMAIFFLSVGLEIKRELVVGELSTLDRVSFPAIAAMGGIVVPAAVYVCFNWGDHFALHGWAIPTATDIAFALGVLSLLGPRVPVSLKIFLTALAIFDDLGAIVIIAIFYTAEISMMSLIFAAVCVIGLLALNRLGVKRQEAYFFIGLLLWLAVLKSGVHATLAGVAIALTIPLSVKGDPETSPLRELEERLLPWVTFLVLPLFAFANAGVSFDGVALSHFFGPIPMGIVFGLLVGKQVGIFGASWLAIKLKISPMPRRASWLGLYAVSVICGVGFTMSLFIGTLAFGDVASEQAALVRFGVLVGSLLAGMIGYVVLSIAYPKPAAGE